jgi:hypothetical protein
MSEDSMLMYLIFFVLGFLVARMTSGNGLSVGGDVLGELRELREFDDFKPCIHKTTESDCKSSTMKGRCFWNNDQKCYASTSKCDVLEGRLDIYLDPVRQLRYNLRRYCAPKIA